MYREAMETGGCVPSISPVTPSKEPTTSPTLPCFPIIRKVKLHQLRKGVPIQVFELQVFSEAGTNIALGKTATQSSTLVRKSQESLNASNAVDGDLTTFSHTKDASAWLEVDLEDAHPINNVGIVNRWCRAPTDPTECLCRLSGTTLSLVDDLGKEISSISIGDTCGQLNLEYVFDPSPEFCLKKVGFF